MDGDLAAISTIEKQDRIKAAFKQIRGYANWDYYWIGLKKSALPMTWLSGEKIYEDSDLQFGKHSYWKDPYVSGCGIIDRSDIDFNDCEQGRVGYICELPVKAATCGN